MTGPPSLSRLTWLKQQTVAQAAIVLVLINILSKPLGLLREMVIANQFGATAQTDAFFSAQIVPNFFGSLIASALIAAFIPVFIRVREQKGERPAWILASRVFTLLIGLLAVISVLLYLFAGPVAAVIAPGFSGAQHDLIVWLTRYMIPLVVLGTLLGLFTAIFNAYQHFILPRVAELLNNVFLIAAVVLLTSRLGIASLIVGSLIAVGIQFLFVGGALLWRKPYLRPNIHWRDRDLGLVVRMMVPLIVGNSTGVLNMFVDRVVGSYLTQSSISALKYSATVIGIPQAMFVGNLAVAIFPTLSLAAAKNEMGGFRRSLVRGLSALWFIVLPSTAGLVFLGQPIISAVYQHGAFTAEATALTVSALLFYALGLFAFAGNALLGNAFVALGDTLTPTMLGLVSVGLNVNLNLILAGPMGAGGLALATSISASVSFLALLYFLRRRIGAGTFRGIWQPVAKMVLASALMGGACLLLWWLLEWWVPASGYWWRLSEAVVVALVGVVLYAGLSRWFRIGELDRYLGYAQRFWRKMQDLRRPNRPE